MELVDASIRMVLNLNSSNAALCDATIVEMPLGLFKFFNE